MENSKYTMRNAKRIFSARTRYAERIILTIGFAILSNRSLASDIYTKLPAELEKYDAGALVHISSREEAEVVRERVIIHQGHQGKLTDGISTLANRLLKQGFSVLLMQMPVVGWNTDNTFKTPEGVVTIGKRGTMGHNQMVSELEDRGGSTLRFFIEPVTVGINYFIKRNPGYQDISMVGLSGGGWTTHIAAAVDSRINLSFPVAGSYPLYLRPYYSGSLGDAEQCLPALYKERASWLDLYILGGYGRGRKQIQILNQFDTCCFFGVGYKTYAELVSNIVTILGHGQWKCVLDSSHKQHQISQWSIEKVIEPALTGSKTDAGAKSSKRPRY